MYFSPKTLHFEIFLEGVLQETNPLHVGRWLFLSELFTFNPLFQSGMLVVVVVGGEEKGVRKRRKRRKEKS